MVDAPVAVAPAPAAVSAVAPAPSPSASDAGASPSPPAQTAPPAVAPSSAGGDSAAKPTEPAAPAHEFAPSLLDEGAAKAAEPAKPGDEVAPEAAKAGEKEAAKPVEPVVVEPPAPIVYDFKWPETILPEAVDKPKIEKYSELLNKGRVAPELGQELLDMHLGEIRAIDARVRENQWEVFNQRQEKYKAAVRADPELGGSRLKTAMRTAASFIEQFGGSPAQQKAIMDEMRASGAGNHPEVFRLFYRAGELLAREGSAKPTPPARQAPLTREQQQRSRYNGSSATR